MGRESEVTNVRVALRCRPLNNKETDEGDVSVFVKDGSTARLYDPDADTEVEFAFDHVYDDKSTQEEVFREVGEPVVDAAFDGFNSTVFAYGQTGSGKSWSMTGDITNETQKGLLPRINGAIFNRIAVEQKEHESRRFLLEMSFFEIYNEIIYDLLDPKSRKDKEKAGGLQVKEHPVLGIHVKGLQQIVAANAEKIAELMEMGAKNRAVGATHMNPESSRSHSICLLMLHQKDAADESRNVYAKLNLVDLAGSERAHRTGATGARLKEGANINKSLSTLGNVINGLVERARGKKGVFIPYRDSKLTRVLQESLGGNSLCTMLATLSPAKANARESLSTLRYAARAKTIKVSVTKNEEAGQIQLLNEEVTKLKKLLAEKAAETSQAAQVTGDGADMEALRAAEEKLAQQIAETEALTKQTWEEKQEASRRHEAEVARMRKAHKDAARRADAERRRRFELLRQKADVGLSVKELSLPTKWADVARQIRTLDSRCRERRAHVGVFRDALATDLQHLRYCEVADGDGSLSSVAPDSMAAHDAAAASALVKRGAAEAVEARFILLVKELTKLEETEATLEKKAQELVADVEASLHATVEGSVNCAGNYENGASPTASTKKTAAGASGGKGTASAKDARRRDRIKLVLEQCNDRRDTLRRSAIVGRANLILVSEERNQHSDLCTIARELAAELDATNATLANDATCPESVRERLKTCSAQLAGSATAAADAAVLVDKASVQLEVQLSTRSLATDEQRGDLVKSRTDRDNPKWASSGDVNAAIISSDAIKPGTGPLGWMPQASDHDSFLQFEFAKPSIVSRVLLLPGVIVEDGDEGRITLGSDRQSHHQFEVGETRIDGTDRALTVSMLGRIISWQSLRLKPDKAEKLLCRPPVRFLQDIIAALTAAVGTIGWLAGGVPCAASAENSKETRRAFFDTLIQSLAGTPSVAHLISTNEAVHGGGMSAEIGGFLASSDAVLAGQDVDGTNALLQLVAAAATSNLSRQTQSSHDVVHSPKHIKRWTTRPSSVSVEIEPCEAAGEWHPLGRFAVDASHECAYLPSDAPAAKKCRIRPEAWIWSENSTTARTEHAEQSEVAVQKMPACRAALVLVEPEVEGSEGGASSAPAAAADDLSVDEAKHAEERISTELATMKEVMLSGVSALVAGNKQMATTTARALKAATEAERGKTEEMIEEVKTLREATARAESQRRAAEDRAAQAAVELEEARVRLISSEERNARADAEASIANSRLADAEAAQARLAAHVEEANAKGDKLATSLQEASDREYEITSTLDQMRQQHEALNSKCVDLERAVRHAEEAGKLAESSESRQRVQLEATLQKLAAVEASRRDAEQRYAETESRAAETAARLEAQRLSALQTAERGVDEATRRHQLELAELKAALEAAQASAESARCSHTSQLAVLDNELAAAREELALARAKTEESGRALELSQARVDELNKLQIATGHEYSQLQGDLKTATSNRDRMAADLEKMRASADSEIMSIKSALEKAEEGAKQAREREASTTVARDAAEKKLQALQERLSFAKRTADDAKEEVQVSRQDADKERARAQAAEKQARKAAADAGAAIEAASKEAERAAAAERAQLEQRTAALTLESDLESLKAHLQAAELEVTAAREGQAISEAAIAELMKARDDAHQAAEAAELALKVAEEERDAARDKEEHLTNEIELLREDLHNGSEAYVNLTDRLTETRDELDETRERLERCVEDEQRRARDFLNANVDIDLESRQYAQKATQEADTLRAGVRDLRRLLDDHLDCIGVKREPTDANEAAPFLIHAVTKLVRASIDHQVALSRQLADAKSSADRSATSDRDEYEDDFE